MIDEAKKKKLIEHIKHRQESGGAEILLPPPMYFDGYDEPHCNVCANNSTSISTTDFAARLQQIQARPDVYSVFVRFYDYDDALEDPNSWIGSDSVYVVTRASLEAVEDWFTDFEVSEVWVEDDISKFPDLTSIPEGYHLIAVWWD